MIVLNPTTFDDRTIIILLIFFNNSIWIQICYIIKHNFYRYKMLGIYQIRIDVFYIISLENPIFETDIFQFFVYRNEKKSSIFEITLHFIKMIK